MLKNKKIIISIFLITIMFILSTTVLAITEVDNGIMKIYTTSGGIEMDDLKGFDIQGYIDNTGESTLISSTFSDDGYHTFLNVNGINGEMDETLTSDDDRTYEEKAQAMQYTAYEPTNEWQNINGINLKVNTQFINNGEQLQIIYTLKNTTSSQATISLATVADVQIDGDDSATIERLEDGSGVRLWTKEGITDKPVQFVFYGKGVTGATDIDNLWIGLWPNHIENMFTDNSNVSRIENIDSSFAFSWVNRTINAGETQTYSVLMEVGEINIPNTGITLDNSTEFYYTDVKINGTVIDKDLKDTITIHYTVDGTEYTLPAMSTTGTTKDFQLDLTSLNLEAGTEHTLKVWATDSTDCESNVEERTFTVTYLKNPELSISNEEWTKDEVTFRITDTKNTDFVKNYQYRINNGEWVNCSKDTDIPIIESGIITVDVRIEGSKSNDYSDVISKQAKVDLVNPTATNPTATKTTCSVIVNSAQSDVHSGIDTTKTLYAIKKGNVWSEWQSSNTFTGLIHNTEYVVKTKSTDRVGNSSESEELTVTTEELKLGNLILKLNNSEGSNYTEDTWTNQNVYIAIEEISIGATTTYQSKENSAQTITATNQETTVTKENTTIITLSVTDGTNTITSDIEHIIKIDKTAPVINELSLDNEEWSTTAKTITGKAIDSLSGIKAYQFSNKENITSSPTGWNNITTTTEEITQSKEILESGKIYFYVMDEAENIGVVNIDTKIDLLAPIITFERANGKTAINVTDTGAGIDKIQYVWSTSSEEPTESEFKTYSGAVTYDGTSKEKIYLWAKAIDKAGNETIESTSYSSIKKPEINSEDEFINRYITFKINSSNEDNDIIYQFKIDDGEWKNISVDSNCSITDKIEEEVKISARALDNAGRYSEIADKTVKVSITEQIINDNEDKNNDSNINNDTDGNSSNSEDEGINVTKKDNTVSPGGLPYTGMNYIFIASITVSLVVITIIFYKKMNEYKDIK